MIKGMTVLLCGGALLMAGCATQGDRASATKPAPQGDSKLEQTGEKAGEIVSQPARDVGIAKTEIPPLLEKAADAPYDMTGLRTCKQITAAVVELNEVLGPDFKAGAETKENRAGRLAEAGGKAVVNTLIPFRGLIREISGAAPAQRRLNAAIDAGFARRGYLRGVLRTRGCKTPF